MKSNNSTARCSPKARKPYAKPRVASYGHVKDIVQGGGGTKGDNTGRATKSCWIAEALYGVEAPRTFLLRAWLSDVYDQKRRWWFLISVYARFGRQVAALIRTGRLPSRLFLPLFDRLVVKANDDTARKLRREIST